MSEPVPQDRSELRRIWVNIYGEHHDIIFNDFIIELESYKKENNSEPLPSEWYRDVIVYSLYVDLFNLDIRGLEERLDYLIGLGISCIWLLPILDSPMRDNGFDIRDYRKIRKNLLPEDDQLQAFASFIQKAHNKGIYVIFDIALNHTSDEHPWFIESRKAKNSQYRNYYIWNADNNLYSDARIIFEGIETSNWKKDGDEYFFHRFFDFQPDLNYRNPKVLTEMCLNLLYWMRSGIDGFRADAIPYLWKEDGTSCENLSMTHEIVRFSRKVLDIARPNTLLLAEACQKPFEVVKYFGDGDECQAGYHFPLMSRIFASLASCSASHIIDILNPTNTPAIPPGSQWFTFLRCHDELSLELVYVSETERSYLYGKYCHNPEWDFRKGQGISARLSELLDRDERKIGLAFSIMLSLPGTPVIYYGDEFGKTNDIQFYQNQIHLTGKDDSRFLVRGKIDWELLNEALSNINSLESKVMNRLIRLLSIRNNYQCFGRGDICWLEPRVEPDSLQGSVLAYKRIYKDETVIVIHNLSEKEVVVKMNFPDDIILEPYGYKWLAGQFNNGKRPK